MNGVSVFPASPVSPLVSLRSDDTAEPMPETKTRRAIKNDKRRIAYLKKQIKAEEQRIALEREMYDLDLRLRKLRETEGHTSY